MTATEMKCGDLVEFLSDRQTHRGPCAGRCVGVLGQMAMISHGEGIAHFNTSILIVKKLTTAAPRLGGGRLWQLA